MKKYVMEAMGVFFLMLALMSNAGALAIGLMLAAMIFIGAHVSGGHYNPAVSLAVYCAYKMKAREVLNHMGAQILGAFLAACLYYMLNNEQFMLMTPAVVAWPLVLMQAIYSAVLCMVVLSVATSDGVKNNFAYSISAGLALAMVLLVGAPFAASLFNPAIALGPFLLVALQGKLNLMQYLMAWVVGPVIGACVASYLVNYLNVGKSDKVPPRG